MSALKEGKVKFFNYQKGYGFVCCDDEDYFVHVTDIEEDDFLLENEVVQFRPVEGHKGLQALDVQRINPPEMKREKGVVKEYNQEKGFGFVERENKADVFVHLTDFLNERSSLKEGMELSFFVRDGREGRDRAYKIKIVE